MNENVNPAKLADLNRRLFLLQDANLKHGNLSFFKQFETFISECEGNCFTVGKTFIYPESKKPLSYYEENFENYYVKGSADLIIPIDFVGVKKLKDYTLEREMSDREIQSAAGSNPMSRKIFWLVLFSLVNKTELGKEYLGYQLEKGKTYLLHGKDHVNQNFSVIIHWGNPKRISGYFFNTGEKFGENVIHLFFEN